MDRMIVFGVDLRKSSIRQHHPAPHNLVAEPPTNTVQRTVQSFQSLALFFISQHIQLDRRMIRHKHSAADPNAAQRQCMSIPMLEHSEGALGNLGGNVGRLRNCLLAGTPLQISGAGGYADASAAKAVLSQPCAHALGQQIINAASVIQGGYIVGRRGAVAYAFDCHLHIRPHDGRCVQSISE